VFRIGFLLALSLVTASAASVTLAWDASPSPEVTGYKIYFGPSSRNYTNVINVGNVLVATVTNLSTGGTYFFAATAYDGGGLESDFSNEVSYTVPVPGPRGPSDLRPLVAFEKRFHRQRSSLVAKVIAVFFRREQVEHVPTVAAADVLVGQRA